jgi:uncharacterized membrane protein YraQ (UPF0718 family)
MDLAGFLQTPVVMICLVAALLLVILAGFVAAKIIANQRIVDSRMAIITQNMTEIKEAIVRYKLSVEALSTKLAELDGKTAMLAEVYDHSRQEIANIARNFGGESQMSKAIEMARTGAAVDEIVLATAIGRDEAETIVKFHGRVVR